MMTSDDFQPWTNELFDQNTTDKFFIEYKKGRFNHMSHALYALDRLKAPESVMRDFVSWMAEVKLEDPDFAKTQPLPRDIVWTFYKYRNEYRALLQNNYSGSLEEFIRHEFPKMEAGMMSSALHGLIHIGYGYASRRDWFVCEGFAFLKSIYRPFKFKEYTPNLLALGRGREDILDIAEQLAKDQEVFKATTSIPIDPALGPRFPQQVDRLMAHHSDRFGELVSNTKFPKGLDAEEFTLDNLPALSKWLVDISIIVYVLVEKPNDFFLLHGVTGSWALGQILPLLQSKTEVLKAVHTFLCCLLVTYTARGCPPLDRSLLEQNDGMTHAWDDLIQKAIVHEDHEREHHFKLVQVCKDMSDNNTDPLMESLYRLAAYNCITHSYF